MAEADLAVASSNADEPAAQPAPELGALPISVSGALRILKNFVSQAGSNLVAQGFAFFSTAYVARCLQAEGFGWIGFAQGFLGYFTLMTDLGLRTVGMREVARHREEVSKWVGHILGLRIALASISFVLFVAVIATLPKSKEFRLFMVEFGLLIFTSALLLDWAFQGLEQMELVALGDVLRAAGYLGWVLIGLHAPSQIFRVPSLMVLSQLLPVSLLVGIFWRRWGRIRPRFDLAVWKDLLRQSLPLSLGGLALQFATGLDVVLLGLLRPASEVGYYSAAFRLAFLPNNFTTVLGFAMFPAMARCWTDQPEKMGRIVQYLSRILILMVLPVVIAGWFFAPWVLALVFGQGFVPATLSFRILLGYLLVVHLYCPFYYLLPACGKERAFMKGMMAGAALGLVANVTLIPLYGPAGAAAAKALAHAAVLLYMSRMTKREIVAVPILRELLRSVLVAVPMVALMWLVPAGWWVKLGIGLTAYLGAAGVSERKTWARLIDGNSPGAWSE